ncbi:MAG: hypothetical protein V4532_10230 [Pseudomonadota bacterium]|nr:hypothetical protein [Burkholderiales bacterium]
MPKLKMTLVVIVAAVTTACATGPQVSSDAYSQGWRRAQVMSIGKDQLAVRSSKEDCRTALGADASFMRFAVASYSYGGNPNLREKRIVAIPNDVDVNVGDWVAVSITDCRMALKQLGTESKGF